MQRPVRSFRRVAFGAGLALAALAASHHARACEAGSGPPLAPLASVDARGDLTLADGGAARLAGIRLLVDGTDASDQAPAVIAAAYLGHRPVRVGADLDRWGRASVWLASPFVNHAENLALALIRGGLAMAWPSELPPNCRNLYLQAEEDARAARLGRWADMQHAVIDAADGQALARQAGRIAIMEGRIMHVGQTRRATYLNFGQPREGASAELSPSLWRELERQGWTRTGLRGQKVRLRGVAAEGRPARLLVGSTAELERLD